MNEIIDALGHCPLFKGFSSAEIDSTLRMIAYRASSYGKGQIVAAEGNDCECVGIVITGSVEIKKVYASGRSITVTKMGLGCMFGEVLMFAQPNKYPSTIFSSTDTQILSITKNSLLELCKTDFRIMGNLMTLLSDKVLVLNKKVKYLSFQTIRQKVSSFILDEYEKQGSLTLSISLSRESMAEMLGVTRPSLSREMIRMKSETIIDFKKREITIISLQKLEDIILG